MNCDSARDLLAVTSSDAGNIGRSGMAAATSYDAAVKHLDECAACQSFVEARRGFLADSADRALSRAMLNVAVPVDLKSRLLAQLAVTTQPSSVIQTPAATSVAAPGTDAAVQPQTTQPQTTDRGWTRRRAAAAVVTAAMLLIAFAGGSWFFLNPQKPTAWVQELVELSHKPLARDAVPFQQTFNPTLPDSEIHLPVEVAQQQAFSLQVGGREIGAAFPFKRRSLAVMLVVIDLRKVLVPDLKTVGNSFQTARVDYPKPNLYATKVWCVGENLYVCYVNSHDSEALSQLKVQRLSA